MNTSYLTIARQCMICLLAFFAVLLSVYGQSSNLPVYYVDISKKEGYWNSASDKALYDELSKSRLGSRLKQIKEQILWADFNSIQGYIIWPVFVGNAAHITLFRNGIPHARSTQSRPKINFESQYDLEITIGLRDWLLENID